MWGEQQTRPEHGVQSAQTVSLTLHRSFLTRPAILSFLERSFDFDTGFTWDSWIFIDQEWFFEPKIENHIAVPGRNVTLIKQTRVLTPPSIVDNNVMNPGVTIDLIEKETGKKIPRNTITEPTVTEKVPKCN